MLDEAVKAAREGRLAEANEFVALANHSRPWADLKPLSLDDLVSESLSH
jgi:hypothetical protein